MTGAQSVARHAACRRIGHTVYLSGVIPVDPAAGLNARPAPGRRARSAPPV
ncbi:hypothetical protein [Xylophilus ampelinus]|uniref:Uncharacterized protein n=1 Tax=Xylophilus ampelinus TaxID=54067 RepID=A0A318SEF2_9BURK|nr:hypothetical protein [Xylophilus ampelinus]MCS4511180.1 hypothetical protein [Xylophilus ampelinus]PYE75066.1 hypothetical protein DFQ15_12019 [Xylophilus ampelinus]